MRMGSPFSRNIIEGTADKGARSRVAEKDRDRDGREVATPGGGGEDDMI
jgi:hypothetical protein